MSLVATAPRAAAPAASRDEPAALTLRSALGVHLRALAAAEDGVRAGEVEPVHQLRVATRRLRATLALFAPLVPKGLSRFAERELAWLGTAVGSVRDLDVLDQAVADLAKRLDPELRGTLGPIAVAIRERRSVARDALVKSLASGRCRRLRARIGTFAGSRLPTTTDGRLGELAPRLLRPILRTTLRAGRGVNAESPPAEVHRLRVRVKRLRYALETLRGSEDKATDKLLRRLSRLQDVLGDYQDAVTQAAWLRTHAETTLLAPGPLLGVGALLQLLSRRARRRRKRFPESWQRFDQQKLHRRVLDELAAESAGSPGQTP
jgi:CHAD domain-containing protein